MTGSIRDPAVAGPVVMPLSAASPGELRRRAEAVAAWLLEEGGTAAEAAAAAALNGEHHPFRVAVVGESREGLAAGLRRWLAEAAPLAPPRPPRERGPVFVFSGFVGAWPDFDGGLAAREPVFRRALAACSEALARCGGSSPLDDLAALAAGEELPLERLHPTFFAVQVGLAALWRSWGVEPAAVVGHSVGEVAAAHVAGVLDLDDAARMIFQRGRLLGTLEGTGALALVALGGDEVSARLEARREHGVWLAARNGPAATLIAGDAEAVEAWCAELEGEGVFVRPAPARIGFHSPRVDSIEEELRSRLSDLRPRPAAVPFFATPRLAWADGPELGAGYWWESVRRTVPFMEAVEALAAEGFGLFLEVSAHPVLTTSMVETLERSGRGGAAAGSLLRGEPGPASLRNALGGLYCAGFDVSWRRLYERPRGRDLAPLPDAVPAGPDADAAPSSPRATILAAGGGDERARRLRAWVGSRLAIDIGTGAGETGFDPALPLAVQGVDSLGGMRLRNRLEAELGVRVSLGDLLRGDRPASAWLEGVLASLAGPAPEEPPASPEIVAAPAGSGEGPASVGQTALWLVDQRNPGHEAHNLAYAFRFGSGLVVPALGHALALLARRHPALRSTFAEHAGRPAVRVSPPTWRPPWTVVDAAAWDEPTLARELERLYRLPFDVSAGPLFRAVLLLRREGAVLLLSIHHLIFDRTSYEVLLRDLDRLYAAAADRAAEGPSILLPSLPAGPGARYADFVAWQRAYLAGPRAAAAEAWWTARLAAAPTTLDLPFDHAPPPRPSLRGRARSFVLKAELCAGLRRLASERGATLHGVLLSAFQALLHRHTGAPDLLVGTPAVGRPEARFEEVVGYFVNLLPMRARFGDDPSFAALLGRTSEDLLGALDHQDYPFPRLVERLAPRHGVSRPALVQAAFVLQASATGAAGVTARLGGPAGARMEILDTRRRGEGQFELNLTLTHRASAGEAEEMAGLLLYRAELFDTTTIARMAGHFVRLLEGALARPDAPLGALPLLSPAERAQQLAEWNDTAAPGRGPAGTHELVLRAAAARPEAVVAASDEETLTYGELVARAARLAGRLREHGVGGEGVPVGLLAHRSTRQVEALLGILAAGAAYLPLDPDSPDERLRFMVRDSGTRVVLASPELAEKAARLECEVVVPGAEGGAAAPPVFEARVFPESLAYVTYTSGSTGRPKGVLVPHRGVTRLVRSPGPGAVGAGEVVLGHAPVSFDASTFEIWGALAGGGRLELAPPGPLAPAELARFVAERRVTTLWLTAPLFHRMADRSLDDLRGVRRLLAGGDVLSPRRVARVLEELPGCELVNGYGPTENTTFTTCHPMRLGPAGDEAASAVGRPIAGTRVRILSSRLRPLPVGVPGELCTGGLGLARGYLGRPGLTAASFVPDPSPVAPGERLYRTGDLARLRADGVVEFLGRRDHQVKVRGFRIELGEVESALRGLPGIADAVVTAVLPAGGEGEERLLAAYVVPGADVPREGLAARLRGELADRLPAHMLPAFWMLLDALPLGSSGKLDRRALPRPEARAGESPGAAPLGETERAVATAWREVLGVPDPSRDDSFFELGGHSLNAGRVLNRLRAELGVEVPLRTLFQSPTLAAFAAEVDALFGAGDRRVLPPLRAAQRHRPLPLSFAQERLWLLDRLEPGLALYNVPLSLDLPAETDLAALRAALGDLLRRHEVLRTVYREADEGAVQEVEAWRPLRLPVVDLERVAGEDGALAVRLAAEETSRPFDLSRAPLLRARLLRREGSLRLLLTVHHIAIDHASLPILSRELYAAYRARRRGAVPAFPELPAQYGDYAVWQRGWFSGEVRASGLAYWRRRLAAVDELLPLPTDRPRRGEAHLADARYAGGEVRFRLSARTAARVEELSREIGATPFVVLLTAYQAFLVRLTGRSVPVVGTPVIDRGLREVEGVIGFFTNMLVLAPDLGGEPTVREALARVRRTTLDAYGYRDVPFDQLVELLRPERALDHHPLFQVTFTATAALREGAGRREGWGRLAEGWTGLSKFDLGTHLWADGDGHAGQMVYRRDLFDRTTVERWAEAFSRLLAAAAERPGTRLGELPVSSPAQRAQLLFEWSDTARPQPEPALVHPLLLAAAAERPEAVAVSAQSEQVTYGELVRRARAVASRLRERGVGPEERVGVLVPRSVELVEAIAGILLAGAAYLPLDPAYPEERLRFMRRDAGAGRVLAAPELAEAAARLGGDVLTLRPTSAAASIPGAGRTEALSAAEDVGGGDRLAYVMYTSGSTGRPKGVAVPHRGVVRLLVEGGFAVFSSADVVLGYAPASFDASTLELWAPLLHGGRLVLAPPGPLSAAELLRYTAERRVTTLWLTARLFQEVAEGPMDELRHVRRWLTGGDVVPPEAARRTASALPDCELINGYGPTENTTFTTFHRMGRDPGAVPLGRPLGNTRVLLADAAFRPAPPGAPAELATGGAGLARGYLGRPGLTAERFVPDPGPGEPGARLYRTGDLARWRADGVIEFLGRLDQQVKVRGYRVEPGEVESALRALAGVADAVVVARSDGGGRLAAYVVPDPAAGAPPEARELRARLAHSLPPHMVPDGWVFLDAVPLTPSGKVDRRALPEPAAPREGSASPPRGELERMVAGIWEGVLGIASVGRREGFFDLGGNSLGATRVIGRLRRACGVDVPLRAFFESATVASLAAEVEKALAPDAALVLRPPPLRVASEPGPAPLSFAQEGLWLVDRQEAGSSLYNVPLLLDLPAGVSLVALRRALRETERRHEVLRTVYVETPDGAVQEVRPPALRLPVVDLSALGARGGVSAEATAEGLIRREAEIRVDLARGPVLRTRVLRLPAVDRLAVTVHHIAFDHRSVTLFFREVETLYRAFAAGEPSPLPPLPVRYVDYARWQRSWLTAERLAPGLEHWRARLADLDDSLELPTDHPRPARPTHARGSVAFTIPPATGARVAHLARALGATPHVVLLAAFQTFLMRLTGRSTPTVGLPVLDRGAEELEGVIGLFTNMLVVAPDLGADTEVRAAVSRVRAVLLDAYSHRQVPFEQLVKVLRPDRSLDRHPLFQVMFTVTPAHRGEPGEAAWGRLAEGTTGLAKFDLSMQLVSAAEGFDGVLAYRRDLFDATTARRWALSYARLLGSFLELPDTPLGALPLLSPAERAQQIFEWNDTAYRAPTPAVVHELVRRAADRRPEATALVSDEGTVSYGELSARAARRAGLLRTRGVGEEARVGVLMRRSVEQVEALLGILTAGAAYLPLDPEYPEERLRFMVEDSGTRVILTSPELAADAGRMGGEVMVVKAERGAGAPVGEARSFPESAAYVMYTSGSTGRPKGVVVPHQGVVRLVRGGGASGVGPNEVFLAYAPISFDASTLEIWAPLVNGGRLAVAPPHPLSTDELTRHAAERRVTTLWLTTPLFHQVADGPLDDFRSLDRVMTGGDVLSPARADRLLAALPGCTLVNGYGPTENTTFTTCHRVPFGERGTPVGRPITGTRVVILDPAFRPVLPGAPGELCTGGLGLARGYLGRPSLTAVQFAPDPTAAGPGERLYRTGDLARLRSDGIVEFLGRRDHQVKVRGFRIELGEIEVALRGLDGVADCVVRTIDGEKVGIVAYVVPEAGEGAPSVAALRAGLGESLPPHMVPNAWVFLDALPLAPSGKLDFRALPAPRSGLAAVASEAPVGEVESLVAGLWEEVLEAAVGRRDTFLELGGHSLSATRVVSRLRRACGVEIPLSALLQNPTLSRFAARVEEALARGERPPAPPLVRRAESRPAPLSFAQERLWLFDRMVPGSPAYNMPWVAVLRGELDPAALGGALGAVVDRHAALRTVFPSSGGVPRQEVLPPGGFRMPRIDLGGLPRPAAGNVAHGLAAAAANAAFDLEHGPLLRALLVRLAPDEHVIVTCMHHIVFDGWSVGVMVRELEAFYAAIAGGEATDLPPLPVQYADFAAWQREWISGAVLEGHMAFWRGYLGEAPGLLELPTDRPRSGSPTAAGRLHRARLPGELIAPFRRLLQQRGATLFSGLLALYTLLLHRHGGGDRILVGTPVAGRDLEEVEGLIGFFVNTLVLAVAPGREDTFEELLDRVRDDVLTAFLHRELPFEKLVAGLRIPREPGRNPLFQTMLTLQNAAGGALALPGVEVRPFRLGDAHTAKFDLTLDTSEEGEGVDLRLSYNAELFDASTTARLLGQLRRLLESALASPSLAVAELSLLSPAEEHQLAREWAPRAGRRLREGVPALAREAEARGFVGELHAYAADPAGRPAPIGAWGRLHVGGETERSAGPDLVQDAAAARPGALAWRTERSVRFRADGRAELRRASSRPAPEVSRPAVAPAAEPPDGSGARKGDLDARRERLSDKKRALLARLAQGRGEEGAGEGEEAAGPAGAPAGAPSGARSGALPRAPAAGAPAAQAPASARRAPSVARPASRMLPTRAPDAGPAPLSFSQEHLWFLDQLEPGRPTYNIPILIDLDTRWERAHITAALAAIVRRHEVLRTVYRVRGGEPVQEVLDPAPPELPRIELGGLGAGASGAAWRVLRSLGNRPFRLDRPPAFRAALLLAGGRPRWLATVFHHISFDAWSGALFRRELFELAAASAEGRPPSLPALPVQYADYALWQRARFSEEKARELLSYWRDHLRGTPDQLALPLDRPRPAVRSGRGRALGMLLAPSLASAFQGFARRRGLTLFVPFLTALKVVLGRYSGETLVPVGSPVAQREARELEPLIGFFLNTLLMATDLGGDPSLEEAVGRVQASTLAAFQHQELPFGRLVQELNPERGLDRQTLFQVMFSLDAGLGRTTGSAEGRAFAGDRDASMLIPVEVGTGTSKFDLSLGVVVFENQMQVGLTYDTDLFDPSTTLRLLMHFERVVRALVASPELPLSRVSLLGPAERAQVEREWSDNRPAYAVDFRLEDLFFRQAAVRPDAVAVESAPGLVTYGELAIRARRIAGGLRRLGVGPEKRVAVAMERSEEWVASLLGILAAGGAYVPVDPAWPEERLAWVLENAGAGLLLTAGGVEVVRAAGGARAIAVDRPDELPAPEGEGRARTPGGPENLAYVIYTSGTTGRPKGVMVEHRGVANRLLWSIREYPVTPADRLLAKAAVSFDVSVWEVFGPLAAGARVVLTTPGEEADADALGRVLTTRRISIAHFVPSLLSLFAQDGELGVLAGVRTLLTSGEALPADLARRVLGGFGGTLRNQYGLTESSITATAAVVSPRTADLRPSTIGRPYPNASVYVAAPDLTAQPVGVAGELLVGGLVVARGYLGRPAATAERFVPDPFAAGLGPEVGRRLYRSGDLARWRPDGSLDFLGRRDHQVKLRGLRIEPEEIASVLAEHPAVERAVVVLGTPGRRGEQLIAYFVPRPGTEPDPDAVWDHLRARLPSYMVPAVFMPLAALPLTPTGKLDRKALPAPDDGEAEEAGSEAMPRSELEGAVAAIWRRVLGRPALGRSDDFFGLGGHSLLAARVIARVRAAFDVELPVRALFEEPTLAGFTHAVAAALRRGEDPAAPPPFEPAPRDAPLPLSFAQERLWLIDQLDPGLALYNIPLVLDLEGGIDLRLLHRCLAEIVRRHEVLRTAYRQIGENPVQEVAAKAVPPMPRVDLGALGEAAEAEAGRLARREGLRPFKLSRPPVLRALALILPEGTRLALTVHHIAFDAASRALLFHEAEAIYRALAAGEAPALAPLPLQYADYAAWQRRRLSGETLARGLEHWRRSLAGAPPALDLPTDRPRPRQPSFAGGEVVFRLPAALGDAVAEVARREAATRFMVLLTAFDALLVRLSGQPRPVVGSPVLNRGHVALEGLIGFFTNMLPLAPDLGGDPDGEELIRRVRRTAVEAYGHQDVPFDRLVDHLVSERDLTRHPLFQVTFDFLEHRPPRAPDEGEGPRIEPAFEAGGPGGAVRGAGARGVESGYLAKFDLGLHLSSRGGGLEGVLTFRRDLFDVTTAVRWADAYCRLLQALVEDPSRRLSALPLLGAGERAQLLREWNDSRRSQPSETTLGDLFERRAAERPDTVAVVADDRALTYAALHLRAREIAGELRRAGVRPDEPVGLFAERGPEQVEAILGILLAEAAYVPFDTTYPAERLHRMGDELGRAWVLIPTALEAAAKEVFSGEIDPLGSGETGLLALRLGAPEGAGGGAFEAASSSLPEGGATRALREDGQRLAYVVFTSGSTGRPKAVAVTQRAVIRLIWDAGHTDFRPDDVLLGNAPASFDAWTFELWGALLHGGRLELAPSGPLGVEELADFVNERRVTILWLTTPLFHRMADGPVVRLAGLRRLLTGGDLLSPAHAARALAALPGTVIVNCYGPTEATTFTSFQPLSRAGRPTLGRPIGNTSMVLVDASLRPVPIGVAGEVVIGGPGLARGYLGRPRRTAEAFVPDPFSGEAGGRLYRSGDLARRLSDGRIDFLGRLDDQVKVRGFRVEPGEIEAMLEEHPEVREARVVVQGEAADEKALAAYVVPTPGCEIDGDALAAYLRQRLPAPSVPSLWVGLEALPVGPAGKLDRGALREAPRRAAAPAEGESAGLEQLLATIWEEVLGVERVGRRDDFFRLGGHSLLATRVITRLRRTCEVDLPLRALFEDPTLESFTRRVAAALRRDEAPAPPIVPVDRGGDLPLSFAQERLWFLERLQPGLALYNVPLRFELPPGDEAAGRLGARIDVLGRVLDGLVRRHEILRTSYHRTGAEPRQRVEAPEPLPLPVVDLGALRLPDRDRLAARLARREARRPFDLGRAPVLRALALLRAGGGVLLLTVHHIAFDLASTRVLAEEAAALYAAFAAGRPSPLPPLSVQYADYAVWQRGRLTGRLLEAELEHWRERLAGAPRHLELPTDRPPGAVADFAGAAVELRVSPAITRRLRELGHRHGATLFMVVLTAFQALLLRLTGQTRPVVGAPVLNRGIPQLESLIGFFTNMLVLAPNLAGDPSGREALRRVRRAAVDAYAHQEVPFDRLVEELAPERDLSRHPLFQVTLDVLEGPAVAPPPVPGGGGAAESATGLVKFDLAVSAAPDGEGGLAGAVAFRRSLFDTTTVRRWSAMLARALEALSEDGEAALSSWNLLSPAERWQLRGEWADPPSGPRGAAPRLVPELFARRAAGVPDAVAVDADGEAWSYGELARRVGGLAGRLRRRGVGPESRVALLVDRSPELPLALLGTLAAGGAYVPLDPSYPEKRIAFMLADSGASVLLTGAGSEALGEVVSRVGEVIDLRRPSSEGAAEAPGAPPLLPDNLAYAIYTSGSTGRPKGVGVIHGPLANQLAWMLRAHPITPEDALLAKTPTSFDASVWEYLAPLAAGARLVLARPGGHREMDYLAEVLVERRITLLQAVPSLFAVLLADPGLRRGHRLRRLYAGGEELAASVVRLAAEELGVEMVNLYGPTEATVQVLSWRAPPGKAPEEVPLGAPVDGASLSVVGPGLDLLPIGVPGELLIGGAVLARGYLDRPARTAESFVPHPGFATGFPAELPGAGAAGARAYRTGDRVRRRADGGLDYLGRLDTQVKVRGHRIEIGELESVLLRLAEVREAVVAVRGEVLVAYVVPAAQPAEGNLHERLRTALAGAVPRFMVPSAFVFLESLPRTPGGKVDRRALPAPTAETGAPDEAPAAADDLEAVLVEVWSEVLGKPVRATDDFFAAGGHSLLAVRLMSAVADRLGAELPLARLFAAPTAQALAAEIRRGDAGLATRCLVALEPAGDAPAVYCVHPVGGQVLVYLPLARGLAPHRPFYALQAASAEDGKAGRPADIPAMARRYLAEVRAADPEGPYHLAGWSFGGVVAFEMARQLTAAGAEVASLVLIDSYAPRGDAGPGMPAEKELLAGFLRDLAGLSGPGAALPTAPPEERAAGLAIAAELLGLPGARGEATAEELFAVFEAHQRALADYRPEPWEGRATLLAAAVRHGDPARGWGRWLTGGGERIELSGDHYSILREPHVGGLAEVLNRVLARNGSHDVAEEPLQSIGAES